MLSKNLHRLLLCCKKNVSPSFFSAVRNASNCPEMHHFIMMMNRRRFHAGAVKASARIDDIEPHTALDIFEKIQSDCVNDKGALLGYDFTTKASFMLKRQIPNECNPFKDEAAPESIHLEDIKDYVDLKDLGRHLWKIGKTTPYAFGGKATVQTSTVSLKVLPLTVEKSKSASKLIDVGFIETLNVDVLLQHCVPSPFGDLVAGETRIDPSARLAVEIAADRFQLTNEESEDVLISRFEDYISTRLVYGQRVHIVPNKLNVYSAGGHFKPPTDTTTHDPSKFLGSVVVCLPSAHEGGELVVRHAGQETVFDFATESNNTDTIQFAAFYGDCEHEVCPVTAGHRVTLTYSVFQGFPSNHRNVSYSREVKVLPQTLTDAQAYTSAAEQAAIFASLRKTLQRTGHLGVFLSHAYTKSALRPENLERPDKLLYDYFIENKVPVSLLPVVSTERYARMDSEIIDCEEGDIIDEIPHFPVRTLHGFTDPRLPVHREISGEIPFIEVHPTVGINVRDQYTPCYNAFNAVYPEQVDVVCIKGAMIVGPAVAASDVSQ